MFKTDDGQIFATLAAAILHEQQTFLSAGLTPLLTQLLSKFRPTETRDQRFLSDDEISIVVTEAVGCLHDDRPLLQEFKKLFEKLQVTPSTPVGSRRTRAPRKKKPSAPPAQEPPAQEPPALETPEHLASLDALAATPITIPPMEEQAPPPPVP